MKLTQFKLRSIVRQRMTEMGLLDRPATPDEIAKIVQAVLAEAKGHKAEPVAPKLVVPEIPDESSAKQALFTVMLHPDLEKRLRKIRGCECWVDAERKRPLISIRAKFAQQDAIRQVLKEFDVCPARRKRPPSKRWCKKPGAYSFQMKFCLPQDWRRPPCWP